MVAVVAAAEVAAGQEAAEVEEVEEDGKNGLYEGEDITSPGCLPSLLWRYRIFPSET